jgi:hypothetical protein
MSPSMPYRDPEGSDVVDGEPVVYVGSQSML